MTHYSHLTEEDREQIYVLLQAGERPIRIAEHLGRPSSTITREIERNSVVLELRYRNHLEKELHKIYLPEKAQRKSEKRRKEVLKYICPLKTPKLFQYVIEMLKSGRKPGVIAGRAKAEGIGNISHECIYQFIYSAQGRELGLYKYLRRGRPKRKKRHGRKHRGSRIPNRVSISRRPAHIEKRKRIGDWEGDSVLGIRGKSALHTEVERVSRYLEVRKISAKKAKETRLAMIDIFSSHPKEKRRTITLDNGTEFVQHERVSQKLNLDIFFAHPYKSCERGTNEHTNGMIRQFFPKGTDFDSISEQMVAEVQHFINHLPRKSLNYKTPHEVFFNLPLQKNLFFALDF